MGENVHPINSAPSNSKTKITLTYLLNYFLPPNTYNQIQIQYVPYQFSIGPSHFKV